MAHYLFFNISIAQLLWSTNFYIFKEIQRKKQFDACHFIGLTKAYFKIFNHRKERK